jgi:hypothetical protein
MFSTLALSQSVNVSVEKPNLKIGEQTILTLNLDHLNSDSVIWPVFDNYITNSIEIIEKGDILKPSIVCDSTICPASQKQSFVITSFEVGQQVIPSIKFTVNDSDYFSIPIPLFIETVAIDTAQGIYDVYDIYEVEYPLTERAADFSKQYWHWFLIALLLVVIFILFKKYKNRPQEEYIAPKIIIPAHIKALETLNKLKSEKDWESENKKLYYSKLTDAVRLYLEDRFGILALEQTTREIIDELKLSDINEKDKSFLKQILSQADFVKFAKFTPSNEDGFNALNQSFEFVEKTKIDTIDPTKELDHVD